MLSDEIAEIFTDLSSQSDENVCSSSSYFSVNFWCNGVIPAKIAEVLFMKTPDRRQFCEKMFGVVTLSARRALRKQIVFRPFQTKQSYLLTNW